MADMAEISQVEACWEVLERLGIADETIPLTYMNSAAAIKAFCGERGGLVCTSSNARAAFEWAFARGKRILFLPDQHLGRNTGFAMGIPLDEMTVWDPWALQGGETKRPIRGQPHSALEGALLGASAFSAEPCGSGARQVSGDSGDRASRVPLGGLPEGRRAGVDGATDCCGREGRRGHDVCGGHGDSPGESAWRGDLLRKTSA